MDPLGDFSLIPSEIRKEIYIRSSLASRVVFKYTCRLSGLPESLSEELQEEILSYPIDYIEFFFHLIEKKSACTLAAYSGNLEVIEWLRKRDCPWDHDTCYAAAVGGHLELLKYLMENGCPSTHHLWLAPADWGHLHIMKWLWERRHRWHAFTLAKAIQFKNKEIVDWILGLKLPDYRHDPEICLRAAAVAGDLEMVKIFESKGQRPNEETIKLAALNVFEGL